MDKDKIFIKSAKPTKIGGQAILGGIMMKGEKKTAVIIRLPDGRLHMKTEKNPEEKPWQKVPLLRGVVIFLRALILGSKVLMYSAEILQKYENDGDREEPGRFTQWMENRFGQKGAWNLMLLGTVATSILFTVVVFILFPTVAVGWLKKIISSDILLNLTEGFLRILFFVLYIWVISKLDDIKEVFQYHGAEHKTIHCFENGLDLCPENCQKFTTLHPRCGTSFLMFVMIISLILFSLLGWPNLVFRVLSRVLLVPVIAGLSYELLRWAGNTRSPVIRVLSMPGLWMQKLTTKEPSREQLEIAVASLYAVLDKKQEYGEGFCDTKGKWIPEKTPEQEESNYGENKGELS